MAYPTVEKTWEYNLNTAHAAGLEQPRYAMLALKTILTAMTWTSPWIVVASSNSTTVKNVGDASPDLWLAYTNIVSHTSGNPHSWIVLKQPGLAVSGNASICIDMNYGNANNIGCSIILSPSAGFGLVNGGTNGTTTARPTATDEVVVLASTLWGTYYDPVYGYQQRISVMQSSDGQHTRVFFFRQSWCTGCWLIERAKNPRPDWVNTAFGLVCINSQMAAVDYTLSANLSYSASAFAATHVASGASNLILTYPAYGRGSSKVDLTLNDFPEEPSGEWPLWVPGIFLYTTDRRGQKGECKDLWWTSITRRTKDVFPSDGSKQFMAIGQLVVPWNNTLPPLLTT